MRKAFNAYSGNIPLYSFENPSSPKLCDIPPGAVVQSMDSDNGFTIEVLYKTNLKTWHGFADVAYIEDWIEPERSHVIQIRNQTPSESDFEQNVIVRGGVKFNWCGEFCVFYCADWTRDYKAEIDIDDWIEEWGTRQPAWYKRIIGNDLPTGIPDLNQFLQSFDGYPKGSPTLTAAFSRNGKMVFTPGRAIEVLRTYRLITGCRIDRQFGRLASSGVAHWMVLEDVQPEGRGGLVKLYNPASNAVETYTWEQVVASVGAPFGLAVIR